MATLLVAAALSSASAVPKAQVLLTGYLPWANFTVNPAGARLMLPVLLCDSV